MSKIRLVLVASVLCSITALFSCQSFNLNPDRQSVNCQFRVIDSGDGDQFNTRLSGEIWYFSPEKSDEDILEIFGRLDQRTEWELHPYEPDTIQTVELTDYDASPGEFSTELRSGYKTVIVWNFVDALPDARQNYRNAFVFIPAMSASDSPAITISTDKFRAGL